MSEHDKPEKTEHQKPKQYHFFVDAKKYDSEQALLTGADIKRIAGVTATYQLFLEEEGDKPDRAISDGENITLTDKTMHFYAVPPATFGTQ
jgi:hypothetical protein